MLKLTSIVTAYGHTIALHNISMHVDEGEIVALVGANGAGKTTVLNTISGITPPAKGTVLFQGQQINRAGSDYIVRLGISHVPEGRQLIRAALRAR